MKTEADAAARAAFTTMEASSRDDWKIMNRDMREGLRGSPWYGQTEEFCALYDGPAFDPKGETLPLAFFEPMLRKVFAQPKNSIYRSALE